MSSCLSSLVSLLGEYRSFEPSLLPSQGMYGFRQDHSSSRRSRLLIDTDTRAPVFFRGTPSPPFFAFRISLNFSDSWTLTHLSRLLLRYLHYLKDFASLDEAGSDVCILLGRDPGRWALPTISPMLLLSLGLQLHAESCDKQSQD